MNLPARLGIGMPSAAALALLAVLGADFAGLGADGDPSPPIVDPVEPHPVDPEPDDPDSVEPEPEEPEPVEPPPPPPPPPPEPLDFEHDDPGDVIEGTAHIQVDEGFTDPVIIAPDMRFPMLTGPAYANSQLFNPLWSWDYYPHTGTIDGVRYERPQGWEYSAQNYAYPWVDNFCEIRTHTNTRCGAGIGHEGQDIRPGGCWHNQVAVAAADGQLRTLSNFSVDLFGDDGMVYRYFHLDRPLLVELEPGEWLEVNAGDPIGFVSNVNRSRTPIVRDTSIHLHFEIWEGDLNGHDPRAPYSSLVEAYRWLGADDPANHEPFEEIGDCSYPDGGLTPTRAQVIAALEAAAAEEIETEGEESE
jgi:murein DD-endopeptidase MepM/ murein hydrolase activator NlpD